MSDTDRKVFTDTPAESTLLKDSGARETFSSGAVRDRQHGKGKPSLVPSWVIWLVSRIYEDGARKYSVYGECECVRIAKELMSKSTAKEGADLVTTSTIEKRTPNTRNVSDRTENDGVSNIRTGSEILIGGISKTGSPIQRGTDYTKEKYVQGATEFQSRSTKESSPNHAGCVEPLRSKDTWIIATRQKRLEGLSVTDAILESDLWIKGEGNGSGEHLSGCPSLVMIKSGERNWEKGMPLSNYIDSAERHLAKLKAGLRDEPHASQVVWNMIGYIFTAWMVRSGLRPLELNDMPDQTSRDPNAKAEPLSQYEYDSLESFWGIRKEGK